MATSTETPKPATERTPLYALVGATDLAVEGVRHALTDAVNRRAEVRSEVQAQVEHLQAEFGKRRAEVSKLLVEPKRIQAELEQVPGLVLGRTLEVAAKAETRYEELAERGKSLVERLRTQKATQDLIDQGKSTLSRTKAAVTTARHAAADVASSARETLHVGRREAVNVAVTVADDGVEAVQEGAEVTKQSAEATEATATKSAARTRAATKRVVTSARKTAATATTAAETGAEKVGDEKLGD
jgi:hypothetical protein